ncbi:Uncharacterised protein [Mycoplasmopsis citelli]|uniref:Uncharacterized protein n=1 Tax=Mycoplasmopsis citelli TaxID=171281 RepID=A0A449B144_9BACT|nr:hypothetical protein [Mycoplasmopsis citelli]VEU74283.1 Uncharacterised protein [Mycoplasmopsis citelli]
MQKDFFEKLKAEYLKALREKEKIEKRKEKLKSELDQIDKEYIYWNKLTKKIDNFANGYNEQKEE